MLSVLLLERVHDEQNDRGKQEEEERGSAPSIGIVSGACCIKCGLFGYPPEGENIGREKKNENDESHIKKDKEVLRLKMRRPRPLR